MKSSIIMLAIIGSFVSFNALAQTPPAPACSPQDTQRIAAETERAVLDRVRADMHVEGRVDVSALGVIDQDCLNNAYQRANSVANNAVYDCQRQTTYFRTCAIQGQRIIGAPARIQPQTASGHIDDKNVNEASCKSAAQNGAAQNALQVCQRVFGMACRIVAGPTEASHRVEQRRRYGLFGPKEDWHICDSAAQALPDTPQQIQCTVEIFARVQI